MFLLRSLQMFRVLWACLYFFLPWSIFYHFSYCFFLLLLCETSMYNVKYITQWGKLPLLTVYQTYITHSFLQHSAIKALHTINNSEEGKVMILSCQSPFGNEMSSLNFTTVWTLNTSLYNSSIFSTVFLNGIWAHLETQIISKQYLDRLYSTLLRSRDIFI